MKGSKTAGALLTSVVYGCLPRASTAPDSVGSAMLVESDGELYIRGGRPGVNRGAIFLVSSHETIPGVGDRRRVGLVQGVQTYDSSIKVAELCPLPAGERRALANSGLPVEPLREDTRARVNNCLATYTVSPDAWDASRVSVDLHLDVGLGDGVREHDRYQVQGVPMVDSLNRTVTDFVPLGQCSVQASIGQGHATCRLDKRQWPDLTRDRALNGGQALLLPGAESIQGPR